VPDKERYPIPQSYGTGRGLRSSPLKNSIVSKRQQRVAAVRKRAEAPQMKEEEIEEKKGKITHRRLVRV
jgi:hypothetical protein